MRVVKPARTDSQWTKEVECATCGAVVEVAREDLSLKRYWDMGGDRDCIIATCCACKGTIVVEDPAGKNWGDLPRSDKKT